ncbi:hypothetical protein TNCV_2004551 [Trichonephila clavipes]|nr:hypothetical protein TNCV_2004551 [Trichonephila clavipes]
MKISYGDGYFRDVLDCRHDLKNPASLGKTVVLQWVPAYCRVPGNEKADLLAKNGVLVMQKVTHPMSFYSIKNPIKRSIKARVQKEIYNRVPHMSWWNAVLNLRNGSRRRAVVELIPPSHRT